MAIAVRLDNGADGGGGHRSADVDDIGRYGREVDLDPGRPQPSGNALGRDELGGLEPTHGRGSSVSHPATRSGRSLATRPSL